jgi:hypothetical protein
VRLGRVETTGREQDVLGARRADQLHQPLDPADPVDDAEPRGRDAEGRSFGGEAQVGLQRERQTAAHAIAADHRDDRLREGAETMEDPFAPHAALADAFGRALRVREPRDVAARGEGPFARAGQDHHAQGRIALDLLKRGFEILEHLGGERVHPFGMVDGQAGDSPLTGQCNLCHGAPAGRQQAQSRMARRRPRHSETPPWVRFAQPSGAQQLLQPGNVDRPGRCRPRATRGT